MTGKFDPSISNAERALLDMPMLVRITKLLGGDYFKDDPGVLKDEIGILLDTPMYNSCKHNTRYGERVHAHVLTFIGSRLGGARCVLRYELLP
jgi:hypothetical protein